MSTLNENFYFSFSLSIINFDSSIRKTSLNYKMLKFSLEFSNREIESTEVAKWSDSWKIFRHFHLFIKQTWHLSKRKKKIPPIAISNVTSHTHSIYNITSASLFYQNGTRNITKIILPECEQFSNNIFECINQIMCKLQAHLYLYITKPVDIYNDCDIKLCLNRK